MSKRKKRNYKKRLRSKKSFRIKLDQRSIFSIAQVVFIALAGLIIVSFSRRGLALSVVNDFMVGNLGWVSVLLPFILTSFALSLMSIKIPLGQPNVIIGSLLLFISLLSLTRSGFLGSQAWVGLSQLLTSAGAAIILLGTTLVSFIILFNTSIDQFLKVVFKFISKYLIGEGGLRGKFKRKPKKKDFKLFGDNQATARPDVSAALNFTKPPLARDVSEPKPMGIQRGENIIWKYPPLSLLSNTDYGKANRGDVKGNADTIESTLDSFGITASVKEVNRGPAVTQYAIEVALGTKLSRITSLEKDLALALAAPTGTIRIEAPIPGRNLVGIELPNISPEFVPLRRMMESDVLGKSSSKLAVSLGLDVSGKPIIADLAKMPHVLIAGQTGSGKSVCINTILSTLLFRASPSEVQFIMVDPKRVELTSYNGIPHLKTPVIVEPDKVLHALNWVLSEMDRRYKLFSEAGARNLESYNNTAGFQAIPYLIVMVDELADVMLFSPVQVENAITRIAQISRATGIHMVLSTQRPSVDVITGLIKANIPCRIAFAVASQVDSRVILDGQGAEKLLGKGDMLYLPPEQAKPMRIQGAYVSDKEITDLVGFIKSQGVSPDYDDGITTEGSHSGSSTFGGQSGSDPMFKRALEVVVMYNKASSTLLQRKLSIGYSRAARIMDQLEEQGVVSPQDGSKQRQVLIDNVQSFLSSGQDPQDNGQ